MQVTVNEHMCAGAFGFIALVGFWRTELQTTWNQGLSNGWQIELSLIFSGLYGNRDHPGIRRTGHGINAIKLAFGEAIQEWDAHILKITAVKFSVYKAQGWTGP